MSVERETMVFERNLEEKIYQGLVMNRICVKKGVGMILGHRQRKMSGFWLQRVK